MSYHISTAALRQARSMQKNQNTVRFSNKQTGLGPVSHTLILAVILCAIGLLYLTQITKTTSFGYQREELKQQRTELIEENQSLSVEAAKLQALQRIKTSEVAKDLTSPSQVDFVR